MSMTIQIAPATEDIFTDTDGADVEASCERFDELAETAIRDTYPDAILEWNPLNGLETVRIICDLDDEACERQRHDLAADVGRILDQVLSGQYGDWVIALD